MVEVQLAILGAFLYSKSLFDPLLLFEDIFAYHIFLILKRYFYILSTFLEINPPSGQSATGLLELVVPQFKLSLLQNRGILLSSTPCDRGYVH